MIIRKGDFCEIEESNGWYYVNIGNVSIHCTGRSAFSAWEIFKAIERHTLDVTESD